MCVDNIWIFVNEELDSLATRLSQARMHHTFSELTSSYSSKQYTHASISLRHGCPLAGGYLFSPLETRKERKFPDKGAFRAAVPSRWGVAKIIRVIRGDGGRSSYTTNKLQLLVQKNMVA